MHVCVSATPHRQLQHLIVLSLTNNALKCLPASIGSLASLTDLSLFANDLDSLPDTICKCAP